MKWLTLTTEAQLQDIVEKSLNQPQVIFKYSTRCSLSDMIKIRLEKKPAPPGIDFYFLDLIAHRALSDKIARQFQVFHESPQILVIKNGECVYEESHLGIQMDEIIAQGMVA